MKECACVGDYCEYWQYARWKTENSVQFTSELLYMMYKTSEVATYKLVS